MTKLAIFCLMCLTLNDIFAAADNHTNTSPPSASPNATFSPPSSPSSAPNATFSPPVAPALQDEFPMDWIFIASGCLFAVLLLYLLPNVVSIQLVNRNSDAGNASP